LTEQIAAMWAGSLPIHAFLPAIPAAKHSNKLQ